MEITILKEKDYDLYRDYVDKNKDAKIYHTLEWKSIIEKSYGYKPFYIIAKQDNEIQGVLPLFEIKSFVLGKRLVSIPFSHIVNILYSNELTLYWLLYMAVQLTQKIKCKYMEIKHGYELPKNIYSEDKNSVNKAPFSIERRQDFYDSILDISGDKNQIFKKFDRESVRWGINKAKKTGLLIKKGETLNDYRKFYQLELLTRKKQGTPVYPFSFFENLYSYLNSRKRVILHLAYLNNHPIAAAISLIYQKEVIYGYGASVTDRELLKTRPMNLLLWYLIKEVNSIGCERLDFGITPEFNTGLLKFKSQWGTDNKKISYYYFLNKINSAPRINRTSLTAQLISNILKKSPLSVIKTFTPILLRQVG